jgi:maleate isomerase
MRPGDLRPGDRRIGLVVPANNAVLEPELNRAAPPGVGFFATRLLVKGDLTIDAIHVMEAETDRAIGELMATGVDVLVYADMVTSFIMGADWNTNRMQRLSEQSGVPCLSAWATLRDAITALGAKRIAIGSPYPAQIHAMAKPFFTEAGFTVADDATLDILAVTDVPLTPPDRVIGLATGLDHSKADAIVLLATDLPTFPVIAQIEEQTGLPVVTSNQALLWAALRSVGVDAAPAINLGRLFEAQPSRAQPSRGGPRQ